jgi:hypothetical protein
VAPTPDSLAAITRRGRLLARYDFVAWHATDAVVALRPAAGEVRGYIARDTDSGWVAVFGRLSEDSATFLIAYEARQTAARPDSFAVTRHAPARPDTSYYASAARALAVAREAFGTTTRPYNAAALPADSNTWWVYLLPAQTITSVYPLGADVRYLVSGDGRRIITKRQMHNTIIEFGTKSDSGTFAAGMHTAVLDNVPEDSDVFHVLARRPRVPHYVVSDAFVYRIDPDGVIHLLGRREDVLDR